MIVNADIDSAAFAAAQDKLQDMGKRATRIVSQRAVRKGATIVNKKLKQTVPVETGALKRSIGVRVKWSQNESKVWAVIGVRPRFVDKKTNKTPNLYGGKVNDKQGFIQAAHAATINEVTRVVANQMAVEIDRIAKG